MRARISTTHVATSGAPSWRQPTHEVTEQYCDLLKDVSTREGTTPSVYQTFNNHWKT